MTRILVSAIALLGLAGAASAQQPPYLAGNYSSNVLDQYNNTITPVTPQQRDTLVNQSSRAAVNTQSAPSLQGDTQPFYSPDGSNSRKFDPNYGGR